MDYYYSIENSETSLIKIQSSKFNAYSFPVSNKLEVNNFLEQIRKKHYDANHNCFAYQIGYDKKEFRTFDDGEPSGSAGKPILQIINKFNFSDILVIVTRYFGGIKLGIGGLVRAYSNATESVLSISKKKIINRTNIIKLLLQYEDIPKVKSFIKEIAISVNENFSDKVEIFTKIPISQTDFFINKIIEKTNARTIIEKVNIVN